MTTRNDHPKLRWEPPKRKAYTIFGAARALTLTVPEVQTLIDTRQLSPIWIANKLRVLDTDIDELLRVYQRVQKKANQKED